MLFDGIISFQLSRTVLYSYRRSVDKFKGYAINYSGPPNENIVQNHLNIALFDAF